MKFVSPVYMFLFALMALTGFAQMPIFKRYYIADIPGLGWLANFYFTHKLHYVGAMLLLAVLAYSVTAYFMAFRKRYSLTRATMVRATLLGAIVITGAVRVLKNLPDVSFSPGFTLMVDISHLGFMMVFALSALAFKITGASWLAEKRLP